jgi:hypothetical protein
MRSAGITQTPLAKSISRVVVPEVSLERVADRMQNSSALAVELFPRLRRFAMNFRNVFVWQRGVVLYFVNFAR